MSFVIDYNCFTPLGEDLISSFQSVKDGKSGISLLGGNYMSRINNDFGLEQGYSRLETMMIKALASLVNSNTITEKTLLLVSTTKGNIGDLNSRGIKAEVLLPNMAQRLADYFGFKNPPVVISNACVSGILAVAVAKRFIDAGIYDKVFVVAGDELSEFVLSGFNSFQALSAAPCKPYDAERSGVTLGEGAAAILISNEESGLKVVGDGSINDANHISGPSRTGEGLYRSIKRALAEAGLTAEAIDFISAHGTATAFNDEMEAIAFDRLEMNSTPLNSLKGYFGHTLGASGLLETVISLESMKKGVVLPTLGYEKHGVSKEINVVRTLGKSSIKYMLKTASGFGGSNTAVIFENIN